MTQREIKDTKKQLREYIETYPDLNNTKLAEKFIKDTGNKLSVRSIRQYISLLRAADENFDLDAEPLEYQDAANKISDNSVQKNDQKSDYKIHSPVESGLYKETEVDSLDELSDIKSNEEGVISISVNGSTYKYDRVFVDKIACAYSRKGLNLSSTLIEELFDISPKEFRIILNSQEITKESQPYSKYSVLNVAPEILYNELDKNVEDIMNLLQKHDGTVITPIVKQYKKAIIKAGASELKFEKLIEQIKDYLPKIQLENNFLENTESALNHLHVIIPDMHIGLHQKNYNFNIISSKLDEIIDMINKIPSNVHLYLLGDIIHTVTGLNHKTSWKDITPGVHGAEAIIKPYEILLNFIRNIKDIKSVNIVGGNHDRMSSDKNEENTGEGAKLIAYMLKHTLPSIKVNFDPNIIISNYDPNLTIIAMHGDNPIDKASGQSIAWEHGSSDKFNYIVTGHMHSRKQNPKDDGLKFRKTALPAFCPIDSYGKTVTHPTKPGFQMVGMIDNRFTVTDISLNYD